MANKIFAFTSLIGGGVGALDSLDGTSLIDGDIALVAMGSTDSYYVFTMDTSSGAADDGENVIAPDAHAGTKRWIRSTDISYTTALSFLQYGVGTVARSYQDKMRDVVDARDYGVVADGVANDSAALNAAIAACDRSTGTTTLMLPPGKIKCSDQLIVDVSGITIRGQGRSGSTTSWGTTLSLEYVAGHAVMISAATQRIGITFENMHIDQSNGGDFYSFESRNVRGVHFNDISFGGVYGFLKAGRAAEPSMYVSFSNIEGNMRDTGTPKHEHFMDAVNAPGMLFFTGHGHIEGATTWPAGSCFLNYGLASVEVDGAQISSWTIRNFSVVFNFRNGVGNFFASNIIGDFCDYGLYADSDTGEIIGINLNGCRFAGGPSSTGVSYGIVIFKTTELVESVLINGCLVRDFGRYGLWLNGAMDATVNGNKIMNVGQQTINTYDGMRIGTDVTGQVVGNAIRSSVTNVHRYGIMIDSTSDDLIVTGNTSVGHGTLSMGNNERGSASDRVVRGNSGQGSMGKYVIGPWGLENVLKSVADDPLFLQMSGGSTNTQHFRAMRRGRITGISAGINATISGGSITISPGINGAAQALTCVLNNANPYKTNTSVDGIAFDANDSLSIRYTTDGSFDPETMDVLAFLEIVDD